METRRVERCYQGTVCVRYAGSTWICAEKETGFRLGERPYVIGSGDNVTVRRVNGRLRETWKRLKPPQELGVTGLIEQIVQHARRVDGVEHTAESVEIVLRATAQKQVFPGSFAGWTREARIGTHSTGPRLAVDEKEALSALLGILGSKPSGATRS